MPSLLVKKLTEAAVDLAEAAQPGARVISELRMEQPRLERACLTDFNDLFNELGERVEDAAQSLGGILIEASQREQNRLAAILNTADLAAWSKDKVAKATRRQWERVIQSTQRVLDKADLEISLRSSIEKELLLQGVKREALMDIKGEARDSLFRVLEEGREQGLNPRDTARLLRDEVPKGRFVDAGSKYRAELIARTETLEAQRHSSLKMYETSEVIVKVVAFDGDKDAECAARNGTEYSFQEAYALADGSHPNCVLAFGPIT